MSAILPSIQFDRTSFLAKGRDGRRVAGGPQRKAPERDIVGRAIRGVHLQRLGFGAGIGQEIAGLKPVSFGGLVQGGNARSAGGIGGKNEWPLGINRLAGRIARLCREEAQDRPPRQPD